MHKPTFCEKTHGDDSRRENEQSDGCAYVSRHFAKKRTETTVDVKMSKLKF